MRVLKQGLCSLVQGLSWGSNIYGLNSRWYSFAMFNIKLHKAVNNSYRLQEASQSLSQKRQSNKSSEWTNMTDRRTARGLWTCDFYVFNSFFDSIQFYLSSNEKSARVDGRPQKWAGVLIGHPWFTRKTLISLKSHSWFAHFTSMVCSLSFNGYEW